MKKLINITTNEQGSQVVSARELHKALEVGREFSKWISKNMVKSPYFAENVDYVRVANNGEQKVGSGGHNKIDYAVTLDTAKKLAMTVDSDKGDEVRDHFLQCEKQVSLQSTLPNFNDPVTAARAWADEFEQKQIAEQKNYKLEAKIEEQKPKIEFANTLLSDDVTTHEVGQAAKILTGKGMPSLGRIKLYKYLRDIGMVFKDTTEPKQSAVNNGYLALKINERIDNNGLRVIQMQTLITNKGIEYLFKKLYQKSL